MTKKTKYADFENNKSGGTLEDAWAIRPCRLYKDEYDDCTSLKARFHQYFIFGQDTDCSQWLTDFKNCERFQQSNGTDAVSGAGVIKSEEQRRMTRLRAHYANDIWQKRKEPPLDWAAPLPEWMQKRNENTYLELKQNELSGRAVLQEEERSLCVVM